MTEDLLFQEEGFSPARLLTRPKLLLAIVAASIAVLAGTVVGVGMIPGINEEVIGPRSPGVAAQGPSRDRGPGAVGETAETEEGKKPGSVLERLKRGIAKLGEAFKRGLGRIRRAPRAVFRTAGLLVDRTFDSDELTFDDLTDPLVEILTDPTPLPSPSPITSLPSPSPSPSASPSVGASPSPSPGGIQPSPSPSPSSPSVSPSPNVSPSPSPATSPSPSA